MKELRKSDYVCKTCRETSTVLFVFDTWCTCGRLLLVVSDVLKVNDSCLACCVVFVGAFFLQFLINSQ